MLHIVLSCLHFFENIVAFAWKTLTAIGHFYIYIFLYIYKNVIDVAKGVAFLGQEFQRFLSTIKQEVDDTIFTIRLFGNALSEFIVDCLKCLENSVPSKEKVEGTSLNLVELLLGSLRLIGDTVWWLITLPTRTFVRLFVAFGDFCIFSLDTAKECLIHFLEGLLNNAMRSTVGLSVIILIFAYWRLIWYEIVDLTQIAISEIRRLLLRWNRRSPAASVPISSVRRSPRRSVSPVDDSKLPDQQRCVVCRTRGKCVLLWPCRHLCLCDGCADVMDEQNMYTCPLCRTDVELTISVYL